MYQIKRGNTVVWSGKAQGKQYRTIMQEDRVEITVKSPVSISFKKGDTVSVFGETYKLNRPENISRISSQIGYTYIIEFEAIYYDLGKWMMNTLDRNNNLTDPNVYIMGEARTILGLLVQNANRVDQGWTLGTVEETDTIQWSYNGSKLLTVLQDVADRTNLEFWCIGKQINLTRRQPETGISLQYGKGKGLYEIYRERNDRPVVTHMRVQGGSQNIPNGYGFRQVQPSGGNPMVNPNYSPGMAIVEDVVTFENVYPRLNAKVTSMDAVNMVRSTHIDFDLNDHLLNDGTSAQIAFTSGLLNGFKFTISENGFDNATKSIKFNAITDENAYPDGVPNNLLKPAIGDSFVLLNISMPTSYVTAAESRVRELGEQYFAEEGTEQYTWSGKITPKFILENDISLILGGIVNLKATDIGFSGPIRISSYVRDLEEEYLYDFTLSNIVTINSLVRQRNQSDLLANTISKGISSDGLSTKATYAGKAGFATMAGHAETATSAATALRADIASDADKWGGYSRVDYMDQPVRTTDNVTFFGATLTGRLQIPTISNAATNALWKTGNYAMFGPSKVWAGRADLWNGLAQPDYINQPVRTLDSVTFKVVNATQEVNTVHLDANNVDVVFNINSDTMTAETQIDTKILNALLQVNTETLNASNMVNTDIVDATTKVDTALVNADIVRTEEISSKAFVSGFAGLGYRLAKDSGGNTLLELDRLTVRKDFTVYELIVSQIRATNGSIWVSDSTKIETVTKSGTNYVCKIDTDGDTIWVPFKVGDIVRCQRFNGKSSKYYTAKVTAIDTVNKTFSLTVIEGSSFPEPKDDIVRIGSETDANRRGAVYMTASDSGAPFIDVIDGVTNASLAGKTKVRLGKLDGIVDPSLGQLSGYGLYANAAYIKGKFIVEAGSNVYTKTENDGKVSTAKSEAISASAIDAQNKANQAQANAIASANQFSLDAVKSITIGGRNLVRDSRMRNWVMYGSPSNGSVTVTNEYPTSIVRIAKASTNASFGASNKTTDVFRVEQGKEYTLSFEVRSIGLTTLNYSYLMRLDGVNHDVFNSIAIPSGEGFSKVSKTIAAPFSSNQAYIMLGVTGTESGWIELRNIKFEKGNKATDWSPNPDEVEDALEVFRTSTTTKFEVLDTNIQSKVSQSDYNALNQRVGTAESTIIQHANQIQSKVAQTQFDTLDNTVGGLSGRVSSAESTITQQSGLIATKVTQSQVDVAVSAAVGNIQVGGRNYITNSAAEWSTPGMSSNSAYGIYRTNLNDLFEKLLGKPLMISFDAKVDLINGATSGAIRVYSSNGNAKYTYSSVIPGVIKDWLRYEAPINLVNTTNTGAGKIEFYGEGANANLVKIYIRNLKLEVGTKATDWSPAPEDVEGELSGLKSRVSTAETSITQNADAITLRATKTEVTTAQNTAIATSKNYTDNSISVTNNAIALKADRTVTDALNTRMNNAEIKITPEQINLTVKAQTESITGDAINRLAIGGTNIYYDSFLKQPQIWGTTLGNMSITSLGNGNNSVRFNKTVTDNAAFGLQRESANQTFSVVSGEEYTISFDIRGNIGYLNYIFLMRNEAGQANQQIHSDISRLNLNGISSTTYIRASTTVKANFTNDIASILLALQVGVTFWFEIRNVKVEKGNKATAWSPNPTEVDSRISSAETSITQNTNAINLRATKAEVTTAQNNAISSSKSYTDSQINVVNNAITLKSDKTVTDGLTARMTSAESKITPDAIKSTVRAETQQIASDAVTSIQVGGRNLLLNSNAGGSYFNGYSGATVIRTINTVSVPEWGASDANRIVSSGGTSTVRVITAIGVPKTGEVVTASGWFRNNGTKNIVIASNQGSRSIILAPGEGKRIVFEGIEGNGVGSVQFQVNPITISDNVDFTWWRLQYEFGNKVTDWTPSPDDVENKVTALNTRVTNAETSITQTNNAIALKADKTVTDGLTNRISTAEAKITPEQINLTVKDQTQAIANNASVQSLSNGKMLYTDPSFAIGGNGIVQYPNAIGTVMTRETNITDAPTVEKTGYKFVHTGLADSTRCSLFRFATPTRPNAIFISRIVAKLPVGWRIMDAHNAYGSGGNVGAVWLSSSVGTGKWEEYILKVTCGATGTFSTINHFDLRKVDGSTPTPTTANPIESYVVWATVYDMSDVQNTPTESEIKAGISITSNAINIFGQSLSLAGKVTFSSLDSSTQGTINTASSNASAAVGTANSANSMAGAANSKADSAIGSANTASSNASNALSTANTANSNASAALSTANTANSNATNAKSKTDAWSYASTTEIDGAKLRTGTVTADKINTDNLIARQIKTSEDSSRASLNEGNDGQFKVRHSNGQVAIQMGLVGGVPKIVFYDSSGNKVWEGGTAGIVYVNDVPESWTTGNLFFMDSIASATETLTTTKINTFKNKIKVNSSGSVTNRQMNAGTNFYLYSEGINATSGTNKQYAGYHTNQVKSVSNFIDNGWYVFGSSTLFSDGPGTGTYSATVFKVFNGVVQDDYVIINGIS